MPEGKDFELKKRQALVGDLEAQLAAVLEREGVPISVAPDYIRVKFKKRRQLEKRAANFSELPVKVPISQPDQDHVRELDHTAVHGRPAFRIKPVSINFKEHEGSGYIVRVQGSARKTVVEEREIFGHLIRKWEMPYEQPPSLESVVVDAMDLNIDEIDPRLVIEQFTPADARVAFNERYGWWSKLRAPFIRWETAAADRRVARSLKAAKEQLAREEQKILNQLETEIVALDPEELAPVEVPQPEADDQLMVEALSVDAEEEDEWQVPALVPKLDIGRVMVGFIVLLALVCLPAAAIMLVRSTGTVVDQVKSDSLAAVQNVRNAISNPMADNSAAWGQATRSFESAQAALSRANSLAVAAAQAVPQVRGLYESANGLLTAGQKSTQAGQLLAEGFYKALHDAARHPDERLITLGNYLDQASPLLDQALAALAPVQVNRLPADLRPQIEELKTSLATGQTVVGELRDLNAFLIGAAGHEQQKKYLVIFQNNTELRPTGGFMGSLAEVTVDRGELTKIYVPGGGPYDLKQQLLARVAPPQPLQIMGGRWEFQDANWFPDFPTAAEKIRWFWSKSGQPTLDGVIAVNASLMEKILAVSGPIEMPAYGKTITADNFLLETQKAVEVEYNKTENKPKKFVGDLFNQLLAHVKDAPPEELVQYLGVMADALETKDIQVAMANPEQDAIVQRFGWSGRIKPALGDALALVEANIAGQKTDGVIDEQVAHQADVQEDGSIIDTVTLTRHHGGVAGKIFSGANNLEYLRVYVPLGSELLSAEGLNTPSSTLFMEPDDTVTADQDLAGLVKTKTSPVADVQVTEEFGRTAFGGWLQLKPGETAVTRFRYRLPFTALALANAGQATSTADHRAAYVLELTSQSGKANRTIATRLNVPASWQTVWSNNQTQLTQADGVLQGRWDRDQVVARLFDTANVTSNQTNARRLGEAN